MQTASDLLVSCLEAEGVDRVFGVPGEEIEDLLFSLRDSSIRFVPTRHEQGAAFMADVHGRLTGEAGVCCSTLGPGATNLITGVADAQLDKSPVVAVTGQGSRERLHKESHQALDIVDVFEPLVAWNTQIAEPEITPESVRKAFKIAEYEKPGATHLEFPEDVASEAVDADPIPTRDPVRRPDPDAASAHRAARLIEAAERPIVLAGNGAVRTRTSEHIRAIVDRVGIPVVETYMGKGSISDREPASLMTLDSGPEGEAGLAIERADCVVAVGYDIAEHDPAGWNPDLEKTIVHVDYEPAEVYRHYNPDVEIVADVGAALSAIDDRLPDEACSLWCDDLHDRLLEAVTEAPAADDPVTVRNALPLLREAMADSDVLVSDVGSHKMAIAQSFPTYEPNTCVISNGLASMGIAVPGALAADLAVDSNVVAGTGDGGFMMNAAELETATRLACGFTTVVFDDEDYGLISEKQREHRGEHVGTALTTPDLVTFAESFGIEAYRPDTWAEIQAAFAEAVPSDELAVIHIRLK
ncbi:acetolactate synthase large subunit [Natrinema longum]|uniref:Acetolactate synthase large subunit n=1 Tax=Natrinema longum TaxID=370324 RepID=A0A8A2UH97_9EURY|nr:acetolactate synthase large subunit [Natrinema longum]MBZ6495389.1 acetolactate synthase large subunit [Natrinema longum]QSW86638.1 acetolactate synthase large subunit [Natrinema longum]